MLWSTLARYGLYDTIPRDIAIGYGVTANITASQECIQIAVARGSIPRIRIFLVAIVVDVMRQLLIIKLNHALKRVPHIQWFQSANGGSAIMSTEQLERQNWLFGVLSESLS